MSNTRLKSIICAAFVFACLRPVAVQADGHQGHHQSGVVGQAFVSLSGCVTLGPVPEPCADAQPMSGTVLVYSEGGRLVTAAVTDEDGFFRVNLKPGDYILTMYIPPQGSGSVGHLEARQTAFTVKKKEFTPTWVLSVFLPL